MSPVDSGLVLVSKMCVTTASTPTNDKLYVVDVTFFAVVQASPVVTDVSSVFAPKQIPARTLPAGEPPDVAIVLCELGPAVGYVDKPSEASIVNK